MNKSSFFVLLITLFFQGTVYSQLPQERLISLLKGNLLRFEIDGDGMSVREVNTTSNDERRMDAKYAYGVYIKGFYITSQQDFDCIFLPYNVDLNSLSISVRKSDINEVLWAYQVKFRGANSISRTGNNHYSGCFLLNTQDKEIAEQIVSVIKEIHRLGSSYNYSDLQTCSR